MRPQARRILAFIVLELVKERLFTLDQEFLDGQLVLRVLRVQLAQFGDEIGGHTAIRVRELIIVKELLASAVIVNQKSNHVPSP